MMFGLFGKEGKATEGGIMSLETVRCLAWTVIILFIMAIVFAFNHGPILAWLAANHTPLFAGIIQSPLWAVAFWLVILMLLCVIGIMDDDETPFAIGMHALGIMMCIGYWAGGAVFASHQPDDVTIYGACGRFHSLLPVRMDHGPASEGGQGDVPETARPDRRFRARPCRVGGIPADRRKEGFRP